MTARIILIGCSAQKLKGRERPAREMYISQLFRKSLAYAATIGAPMFITSAKHELLELDQVIEPYNARLGTNIHGRRAWGCRTADLVHALGCWTAHHVRDVVILAGSEYVDAVDHGLRAVRSRELKERNHSYSYRVTAPMKGMQIGERLSWLTAQHRSAA